MFDPTHGLFHLPDKAERERMRAGAPLNPLKIIALLTAREWIYVACGLYSWIMDSYDFFSVSMSIDNLVVTFYPNVTNPSEQKDKAQEISYSIMLTLLLRTLGAVTVGLLADKWGRRWILSANLLCVAALSLGTAFCTSYGAFLGVRCVFGIFMGGIWGLSTATALEDINLVARGLFSGILQQGYAMGYLVAAAVNLGWATHLKGGEGDWRVLFYLGAGLSLGAAIFRAILPEGATFRALRQQNKLKRQASTSKKNFFKGLVNMLSSYGGICIYGILLMTGFNFLSHSSQDLYPTMVKDAKMMSSTQSSQLTIIMNCGAIVGGIIAGYVSQYTGRRIAMIMFIIFAGAIIPLWILPDTFGGLAAGAFLIQFGVQGAWGVIPAYLTELSPPQFRATYPGLAYQLGNMASSASSTIETRGGKNIRIDDPKHPGQTIPDTATVSAILMGCVTAYLLIVIMFGVEPKQKGSYDVEEPTAKFEAGPSVPENSDEEAQWSTSDEKYDCCKESPMKPVGDVQTCDDISDKKL